MYHLPHNSHTLPRSLATVCFIQWMSPDCFAWHNVSHCTARRLIPTACAMVSQEYNTPPQSQRQLWPLISSNTEHSCFHSTSVKRGGSDHSVGPWDAFCSQFHAGNVAERKGLWGWELSKALHIQDTNCPSHSAVLPGARECWRRGE